MRTVALAVLVLLGLVPAAGSARPGAPRPDCVTAGRTLMASSQVRVFRFDSATYACWVRGRRVRRLVTTQERGSEEIVVTGRRVAWSTRFCDGLTDIRCEATVRVMDVRTGELLVRSKVPDERRTSGLALTERRGVAWIEHSAATARVVALTRLGVRHVLADDPAIRRSSLALRRNILYWLLGDAPQAAEMP